MIVNYTILNSYDVVGISFCVITLKLSSKKTNVLLREKNSHLSVENYSY